MTQLRPAITLLFILTLITGGLYPWLTTVISQALFPWQAGGSLVTQGQQFIGSALIARPVDSLRDFTPRPSASGNFPWNPAPSGSSNLAASNSQLDVLIRQRVQAQRRANPQAAPQVPVELVTASASGLDPNLSVAAARWQVPRIAQARGIDRTVLERLVNLHTRHPWPAFIGQPVVNVITLNQALYGLSAPPSH